MAFTGIPAEAFDFYDGLAVDNSKAYWTDHRALYEEAVRAPLAGLAAELEPRFGPGRLYRPYRDVRFSKDKSPIKDHQGLYVGLRNGIGWYAQLSAGGLMVAGGWYAPTPAQVARYRDSVAADDAGQLATILGAVEGAGCDIGGNQLKTRPRGVADDHPRLELLRYRSLYAWRRWDPAPWMGTRRSLSRVTTAWEAFTPLMEWLADHVGPEQE